MKINNCIIVCNFCGSLTQPLLCQRCLQFVWLVVYNGAWWCHSFVSMLLSDINPIECCDNLECNNLFPSVLRNHWISIGLMLKGKQDENWFLLLASMISQWNNWAEFRVNVYPRQEDLLSFNLDYIVWYRRKTKMFVDPKNTNIATLVFISFWLFNFNLFFKAWTLISWP